MVNESERKEMVAYLRCLGNGGYPKYSNKGICGNILKKFEKSMITEVFEDYYNTVGKYEKFSGHVYYPVTINDIYDPENLYDCAIMNGDLWKGDYGKERREFALYLADELEKEGKTHE